MRTFGWYRLGSVFLMQANTDLYLAGGRREEEREAGREGEREEERKGGRKGERMGGREEGRKSLINIKAGRSDNDRKKILRDLFDLI